MSNNRENVSSNWAGFHRLWLIIAFLLLLLLALLWLFGYGPGGKNCAASSKVIEKTVEIEKVVESPKLLSRIGALEKENAGIAALQATIKELQTKAATAAPEVVIGNSKLLNRIETLEKENAKIAELQATIEELKKKPPTTATAPDTIAPRFALKDSAVITIPLGKSYTDAGYLVVDNIDSKVDVKVTGEVDTKTPGEYILTYKATDSAGNTTTETRKVIVEAPAKDVVSPRLSLNGPAIVKIPVGDKYVDTGATAIDDVSGKTEVKVTGEVDTNRPDTYTIIYSATDKAGNTSTITRDVIVEATAEEMPVTSEMTADTALPATAKLYFRLSSATPPADSKQTLSSVIAYLKAHSDSTVIVSGFHDPSGNPELNKMLSHNRALAVSALLQKLGIALDRIKLEKPAETTGTGSPREARRVEVRVSK